MIRIFCDQNTFISNCYEEKEIGDINSIVMNDRFHTISISRCTVHLNLFSPFCISHFKLLYFVVFSIIGM